MGPESSVTALSPHSTVCEPRRSLFQSRLSDHLPVYGINYYQPVNERPSPSNKRFGPTTIVFYPQSQNNSWKGISNKAKIYLIHHKNVHRLSMEPPGQILSCHKSCHKHKNQMPGAITSNERSTTQETENEVSQGSPTLLHCPPPSLPEQKKPKDSYFKCPISLKLNLSKTPLSPALTAEPGML